MPRSDASRKRCAIYTRSQGHEGWILARTRYDDGGFSGGNMDRPALQRLLADIREGRIDIIVVYKVDRLTRSLADFARLVETFDAQGVSFVSVTQQFNTTSSMGRRRQIRYDLPVRGIGPAGSMRRCLPQTKDGFFSN